jgi:hypothetical protein
MVDSVTIFLIIWAINGLAMLVIGKSGLRVGQFLKPYGAVPTWFGYAFLAGGTFGLLTTAIGAYRVLIDQVNPAYTSIGYVAAVRLTVFTLFWVAIAIAAHIVSKELYRLTPGEREAILEFHRSAFRKYKSPHSGGQQEQ